MLLGSGTIAGENETNPSIGTQVDAIRLLGEVQRDKYREECRNGGEPRPHRVPYLDLLIERHLPYAG